MRLMNESYEHHEASHQSLAFEALSSPTLSADGFGMPLMLRLGDLSRDCLFMNRVRSGS